MAEKKKVRNMRIYQEYFDMIKDGSKTIEIRVAYSSMKRIKVGTIIRFNDDPDCERRVTRVAQYSSFSELLKTEDLFKINPNRTAEEQLADLQRIFPAHKEKLGILIFELEEV